MQLSLLVVLWIGTIILAMFAAAWITVTYVTKDMAKAKPSSSAVHPIVTAASLYEEAQANMKQKWAERIPSGETHITWLI